MKIYDITQPLLSCKVYPGDPASELIAERRIAAGEVYNLSSLKMGVHNGTHLDAPFHFFMEGETVDQIPLEKTVGQCYVALFSGDMTAIDAASILQAAGAVKKLLIKGDALITEEAATRFAAAKIDLLGVESQSVGPMDAPMAVHKILLGAGVILLEGLRLTGVTAGEYLLHAAPLNLAGSDGAPCRATLIG